MLLRSAPQVGQFQSLRRMAGIVRDDGHAISLGCRRDPFQAALRSGFLIAPT
jgi:hypothetical protein